MSVASRVTKLEEELERRRLKSPVMRGAWERHCPGGLGRIEGEPCKEHQDCVFKAEPITAPIRRMVIVNWYEGMTSLGLG